MCSCQIAGLKGDPPGRHASSLQRSSAAAARHSRPAQRRTSCWRRSRSARASWHCASWASSSARSLCNFCAHAACDRRHQPPLLRASPGSMQQCMSTCKGRQSKGSSHHLGGRAQRFRAHVLPEALQIPSQGTAHQKTCFALLAWQHLLIRRASRLRAGYGRIFKAQTAAEQATHIAVVQQQLLPSRHLGGRDNKLVRAQSARVKDLRVSSSSAHEQLNLQSRAPSPAALPSACIAPDHTCFRCSALLCSMHAGEAT